MRNATRETDMKRIALAALCFAAPAAFADGQNEELIDEYEIRLSEMEVIEVTAEKSPVAIDDELDPDIEAILERAEALEEDAAEE